MQSSASIMEVVWFLAAFWLERLSRAAQSVPEWSSEWLNWKERSGVCIPLPTLCTYQDMPTPHVGYSPKGSGSAHHQSVWKANMCLLATGRTFPKSFMKLRESVRKFGTFFMWSNTPVTAHFSQSVWISSSFTHNQPFHQVSWKHPPNRQTNRWNGAKTKPPSNSAGEGNKWVIDWPPIVEMCLHKIQAMRLSRLSRLWRDAAVTKQLLEACLVLFKIETTITISPDVSWRRSNVASCGSSLAAH